jgi:hypothetical protein
MKKKAWIKPKLIVLFKGRPEEAVLAGCKGTSGNGPSGNTCAAYTNPCSTLNNNPS